MTVIVVSLTLLVFFEICEQNKAKHSSIMHEEQFYKEQILGILESKSLTRGKQQIVLRSDGDYQTWIIKPSRNYQLFPSNLYDFLKKGDSLYKVPNSLDLYIFRKNKKYFFELGAFINE